jgi:hypothetical protein
MNPAVPVTIIFMRLERVLAVLNSLWMAIEMILVRGSAVARESLNSCPGTASPRQSHDRRRDFAHAQAVRPKGEQKICSKKRSVAHICKRFINYLTLDRFFCFPETLLFAS